MKILKIMLIVLTVVMIINVIQPKVEAASMSFDDMKGKLDTWKNAGKNSGNASVSGSDMKNIIVPIANILTAIGVFVLVGVTIIMGIKYMFATPDEAAKLKQQLIGLVVSAVVVLGATAIWKIVYNVLKSSGI